MNVLHVIPSVSPQDGGPSKAIASIERALTNDGIRVTTLTTRRLGKGSQSHNQGGEDLVQASRVFSSRWTEFYKVAPSAVVWLWKNARSFDVIHVHTLFSFISVAAAWIARTRKVPYVVRPLGTLSAYGLLQRPWIKQWSLGLIERPILGHASAVHFTSDAELNEARLLKIPFTEVVIPLGIEEEWTSARDSLADEYPCLAGRCVILSLSRLDKKKNIEGLIQAFASSDNLRESAALLIAGSGETGYVDRLSAQAKAAGVSDHIVWLGHVDAQRKSSAFAAADIFVLPSFSENFGIAVVEALLAGLPCVLSKGVAIAGEVAAGGAGIAIESSTSQIANALETLVSDASMREAMGERGRALALSRYSASAMSKRLINLYESVIAKTKPLPA